MEGKDWYLCAQDVQAGEEREEDFRNFNVLHS